VKRLCLAASFFALFVFSACKKKESAPAPTAASKTPAPSTATAVPTDAMGVVTAYTEHGAAERYDQIDALLTDDFEMSMADAPKMIVRGRAALREHMKRNRSMLGDMRWSVKRVFELGDEWAAQVVARGVHSKTVGGIAPTGKTVGMEAIWFITPVNGKIKRLVAYPNRAAFMKQLGLLKGTAPYPVPETPGKAELVKGPATPANVELVRRFYDAISRGDFAAADAMTAPGMRVVDHGEGLKVPWSEYRKLSEQHRLAFPDTKITVEKLVSVGDFVVARSLVEGTNTGSMEEVMSMKPTGKKVVFHLAELVRFEGGKLASLESYSDQMSILAQLGLMPVPPRPAK